MILRGAKPYARSEDLTEAVVEMSCSKGEEAYDLAVALNYGHAAGSPQLLRFVTEHVDLIHDPPYRDWACSLTCSTTSAIDITFRLLCNPGDWIICETFTYPGTVEAAKAQGLNILGIEVDDEGLIPDDLDLKLQIWDATRGRRPFVLYTIPSGHNPTGITQSAERRKAVYQAAEQHDLYIIEDDPYSFLSLRGKVPSSSTLGHRRYSCDEYLEQLPPSYLSLDQSGRVLRMDTTSKILAPGLRCGWISGCAQIIEKFVAHTKLSTVAPSGVSQVLLYKLLDETWSHEGFIHWLKHLSLQYRRRRDILVEACDLHLPREICHWTTPTMGMFLWVQLDLRHYLGTMTTVPGAGRHTGRQSNPEVVQKASAESGHDPSIAALLAIERRIYIRAKQNEVLVGKGSWFAANKAEYRDVHFRLTFAAAPENCISQAIERFASALRAELCPPGKE